MSGEKDWDVEQHKTEYECDEHWELRRKFLLAHKDKFPEDELVCLAQVFSNVEILGCRYPKETMELIAELSADVVTDYRERQKSKLQRTFVKASDAASSKVKGLTDSKATGRNKSRTIETIEKTQSHNSRPFSESMSQLKRMKSKEYPFGNIILVEKPGDVPGNVLSRAVNNSGGKLEKKIDKINDLCKCSIFIDSKLLAEGCSSTQKEAKKEAAILGLRELQKYYYTIKSKQNKIGDANVTTVTLMENTVTKESISDDNIGKKLLKSMGWTGGGLGKSEQGITEPITVKQQFSKQGLGLTSKPYSFDAKQQISKQGSSLKSISCSTKALKFKTKELMRNYLAGDMKNDLVFPMDLTREERAVVHKVAYQMGLKSQSYGSKDQRTMVVSQKLNVRSLVEELKRLGGSSDKYELIKPMIQMTE